MFLTFEIFSNTCRYSNSDTDQEIPASTGEINRTVTSLKTRVFSDVTIRFGGCFFDRAASVIGVGSGSSQHGVTCVSPSLSVARRCSLCRAILVRLYVVHLWYYYSHLGSFLHGATSVQPSWSVFTRYSFCTAILVPLETDQDGCTQMAPCKDGPRWLHTSCTM